MSIDVLCVGATAYDFYFGVERHPEPDEKTTAKSFLSCGGGPAANAAVTVAKMGKRSALIGYLGRDFQGDRHLEELEAQGVDTRWMVRGDFPTPTSAVWVKPDGTRSLVNYRVKEAVLKPMNLDFSDAGFKAVLFDGHEPAVSEVVLEHAALKSIPTVLDAGSVHPGTLRLYDRVDYLVCSSKFAASMTKCKDPREALGALARKNKNVVITLGASGLVWKTEQGEGCLSAFKVDAVDTTGAGDVFHGAFCACLAEGRRWPDTLMVASAAAALSCTRLGARTGIPTSNEIEVFLDEHRRV